MEPGRLDDRRRGRRVDIQAPMVIRRVDTPEPSHEQEHLTRNVSLAGVYFETAEADAWSLNDAVVASVAIPEAQRRVFPFTRLAGRSRVVRIDAMPQSAADGRKRIGVALEFGQDLTALTAIPARG